MSLNRSFLEQVCYEIANEKLPINAKLRKEIARLNNELYDDNTFVKAIDRDDETIMILIYKQGKIVDALKIKDKSNEKIGIENKDEILVKTISVYEISEWLYKYIKNKTIRGK